MPLVDFCAVTSRLGLANEGTSESSGHSTTDKRTIFSDGTSPAFILVAQLQLLIGLCVGRHEDNIALVRQLCPPKALLIALNSPDLPPLLRAAILGLLTVTQIDVAPFVDQVSMAKSVVYIWNDIDAEADVLRGDTFPKPNDHLYSDDGSRNVKGATNFGSGILVPAVAEAETPTDIPKRTTVNHVKTFVQRFLKRHAALDPLDTACNHFVEQAIMVTRDLVRLGFITRDETISWIETLTPILDGSDDIIPQVNEAYLKRYGQFSRYHYDEFNHNLVMIKLNILEIYEFLAVYARATIISRLVIDFKKNMKKDIRKLSSSEAHHHHHAEKAHFDEAQSFRAHKKMNKFPHLCSFLDFRCDGICDRDSFLLDKAKNEKKSYLWGTDNLQTRSAVRNGTQNNHLSYLRDLLAVLVDNAQYRFKPLVVRTLNVLISILSGHSALLSQLRVVQVLSSSESVSFYRGMKPRLEFLSKFTSFAVPKHEMNRVSETCADILIATRRCSKMKLCGEETHAISINMGLHTIVSSILKCFFTTSITTAGSPRPVDNDARGDTLSVTAKMLRLLYAILLDIAFECSKETAQDFLPFFDGFIKHLPFNLGVISFLRTLLERHVELRTNVSDISIKNIAFALPTMQFDPEVAFLLRLLTHSDDGVIRHNQVTLLKVLLEVEETVKGTIRCRDFFTGSTGVAIRTSLLSGDEYLDPGSRLMYHCEILNVITFALQEQDHESATSTAGIRKEVRTALFGVGRENNMDDVFEVLSNADLPQFYRCYYLRLFTELYLQDRSFSQGIVQHKKFMNFLVLMRSDLQKFHFSLQQQSVTTPAEQTPLCVFSRFELSINDVPQHEYVEQPRASTNNFIETSEVNLFFIFNALLPCLQKLVEITLGLKPQGPRASMLLNFDESAMSKSTKKGLLGAFEAKSAQGSHSSAVLPERKFVTSLLFNTEETENEEFEVLMELAMMYELCASILRTLYQKSSDVDDEIKHEEESLVGYIGSKPTTSETFPPTQSSSRFYAAQSPCHLERPQQSSSRFGSSFTSGDMLNRTHLPESLRDPFEFFVYHHIDEARNSGQEDYLHLYGFSSAVTEVAPLRCPAVSAPSIPIRGYRVLASVIELLQQINSAANIFVEPPAGIDDSAFAADVMNIIVEIGKVRQKEFVSIDHTHPVIRVDHQNCGAGRQRNEKGICVEPSGDLFALWNQYRKEITEHLEGTDKVDLFETAALFLLRKTVAGNNALKSVVRIIDHPNLDADFRISLLHLLKKILTTEDKTASDAMLLVPEVEPIKDEEHEHDEIWLYELSLNTLTPEKTKTQRQDIIANWCSTETTTRESGAASMVDNTTETVEEYRLSTKLAAMLSCTTISHTMQVAAVDCMNQLLDEGNNTVQNQLLTWAREQSDEKFIIQIRNSLVVSRQSIDGMRRILKREIPNTKMNDMVISESLRARINQRYNFQISEKKSRFIQLLCEGHFLEMQDFLRVQAKSQVSINVLESIVAALQSLLKGLNQCTFSLTIQTFATLAEMIQGPCFVNQEFLVSQSLGQVVSQILATNYADLTKEQLWELRMAAMTFLLALMEGHMNFDLAVALTQNMDMMPLVKVMDDTYNEWTELRGEHSVTGLARLNPANWLKALARSFKGKDYEDEWKDILNLSTSIYIFLRTLLDFDQLNVIQGQSGVNRQICDRQGQPILDILRMSTTFIHLSKKVAGIEILRNECVERVYFRVPSMSVENLHAASRDRVINVVERGGDGTRLASFFEHCLALMNEIEYYEQIRETPGLALLYRYDKNLDDLSIVVAFCINIFLLWNVDSRFSLDSYAHIETGLKLEAFRILGAFQIAVQLLLFINFFFGPTRIYLHKCWLDFQQRRDREAIARSKATASIEPPKFEPNLRERMWAPARWLRNCIFVLSYSSFYSRALFLTLAFLGYSLIPIFNSFQTLQIIAKSQVLQNVVEAVLINKLSLGLTGCLLLCFVYIFAIFTYYLFPEMIDPMGDTGLGGNCETLFRCTWISLVYGLKMGGGISEITTPPIYGDLGDSQTIAAYLRLVFDFLFFLILIIIFLNLVFGIILDTFGQLREHRDFVRNDQENKCFICGIEQAAFDRIAPNGFQQHVGFEHNMWHYLYHLHRVKLTPPDAYTGLEGYVAESLRSGEPHYFPIGRALVIDASEGRAVKYEEFLSFDGRSHSKNLQKSGVDGGESKDGSTLDSTDGTGKSADPGNEKKTDRFAQSFGSSITVEQRHSQQNHNLESRLTRIETLLQQLIESRT